MTMGGLNIDDSKSIHGTDNKAYPHTDEIWQAAYRYDR